LHGPALRQNPDIIANLTVPETVDHLAGVIEALDTPPFIIGHSFGGTLTQLLLARGLGCVGVVIDSAPTEGVHVTPLSQIRSFFPALKDPANIHKAVAFTAEEFHYAFANTLSAEDSRAAWQRYTIAAPSTTSSQAETTGPAPLPAGRPSRTTRSSGPRNTRRRRLAPDGERTQDRAAALEAPTAR
jgi:pimeloyl-ACP methyl ester carboxylesterase